MVHPFRICVPMNVQALQVSELSLYNSSESNTENAEVTSFQSSLAWSLNVRAVAVLRQRRAQKRGVAMWGNMITQRNGLVLAVRFG